MEDKAFCILSLGSNMGDRRKTIDGAIAILEASSEITGLKRASYYETEPVGYEDQAWFLNTCVSFETSLEPLELLDLTQSIEQEFHRERTIHWGPRTLDIDIITYGNVSMDTERLTIPHPRWYLRSFVTVPLRELRDVGQDHPDDKEVSLYRKRE